MRKKLLSLLRSADLRDEEIQIYLLLLKLQRSTIPELIAKTGLPHMTVYRTIHRLQDQQMIESIPLNDKQSMYRPLSLTALVKRVNTEQRKLRKLEMALRNLDVLLPYIDTDLNETSDDLIEVRDGLDAFREEYLKFPSTCKEEYLHIGNMDNYWDAAQMTYECPEERHFINLRMSKNIHCRIVNMYTKHAEEFVRNDSKEKRRSKLSLDIPLKKNYLGITEKHATYFLCDAENPRAIVIKQPELLEMYKHQFELLWKNSIS